MNSHFISEQKCQYPIAFYARRDNSNSITALSIVDFKEVVTDTCNVFDNITSVFTCPVAGVYVFNVWILDNADDKSSYLQLMKNGTAVGQIWGHRNNQHDTGGNTAILILQKADRVYVRVGPNSVGAIHGSYSTFSGFKLN